METTSIKQCPAKAQDIPAIAHYLGTTCATVIRRYTLSDLTVLKSNGKVSALWRRVGEKFFEKVEAGKRLKACCELFNLSSSKSLHDWQVALHKRFSLSLSVYDCDSLYFSADEDEKCVLLGELFARWQGCTKALLKTEQPYEVFEKFRIPSMMRFLPRNQEDYTWWIGGTRTGCPIEEGGDYTLFGERDTTENDRRFAALNEIDNLALYTLLATRVWGDDPPYWHEVLKNEFKIKPEVYRGDPKYEDADAKGKCKLLGTLYERLICCRYELRTGKPDEVFEKYKLPSKMRNITHGDRDDWWAKSSECKRYPITDGHDYTLFGERVKTWKNKVADGIEDESFRTLILKSPHLTPKEWKDHLWHYLGVKVEKEATCEQLRDLFERILHFEHDLRETSDPTGKIFHRYLLPKSMYRLVEYQEKRYLLTTLTSRWFKGISLEAKEWADKMLQGKMVERPKCITWYIDLRCIATNEFSLLVSRRGRGQA